jgi:hypothetical protein
MDEGVMRYTYNGRDLGVAFRRWVRCCNNREEALRI